MVWIVFVFLLFIGWIIFEVLDDTDEIDYDEIYHIGDEDEDDDDDYIDDDEDDDDGYFH